MLPSRTELEKIIVPILTLYISLIDMKIKYLFHTSIFHTNVKNN